MSIPDLVASAMTEVDKELGNYRKLTARYAYERALNQWTQTRRYQMVLLAANVLGWLFLDAQSMRQRVWTRRHPWASRLKTLVRLAMMGQSFHYIIAPPKAPAETPEPQPSPASRETMSKLIDILHAHVDERGPHNESPTEVLERIVRERDQAVAQAIKPSDFDGLIRQIGEKDREIARLRGEPA